MNTQKHDLILEIVWHSIKWILTIVFVILKLAGVIDWHIVLVFSPLLISLICKVICMFVLGFLVCVLPNWIERWKE